MASATPSARKMESLDLVPGSSAKVQVIDTGARITLPVANFMTPPLPGHTHAHVPSFSFLIEQPSSGRKLLFDLGVRKHLQALPPAVQNLIREPGWSFDVPKSVAEILREYGLDIDGGAIEAVVWSHWHFDHTGDVGQFPPSTTLVTGAGLRSEFFPPYPENQHSPLIASDFEGREHRELEFDAHSSLRIGGLAAIDYFGDGSFYLVNTPGHAVGHICGLARVTSKNEGDAEDTFVYMGGDTAHHGGEFRPSEYLPMPKHICPSPYPTAFPSSCPGHIFEAIHRTKEGGKSFYEISKAASHNHEDAVHSNERMQALDAAHNVLVIIAHDSTFLDEAVGLKFFPRGSIRDWKAIGSAEKARWMFLKDFIPAVEHSARYQTNI
ncbi:hypothetical protein F66182_5121 [Fusarium sp. NRRL 66182]|nr:hypothetical protein F66182_5121 [Fusarium sp. NRRL 66182]